MEATTTARNVSNETSDLEHGPQTNMTEEKIRAYLKDSKNRFDTPTAIAKATGSYAKVVERHLLRLMAKNLVRYSEDEATGEKFYKSNEVEDEEDDGEEIVEQVLEEVSNGVSCSSISEMVEQLGDKANGEGWEIEIRLRKGAPGPKVGS